MTKTEEQKREEQRKVENRVRRWNESVAKVQALAAKWQREELARLPNKVLLHPVEWAKCQTLQPNDELQILAG